MQASDVYVTVGLDRQGNVVEVTVAGRRIEPREGARGLLKPGDRTADCEEILQVLLQELLVCRKKGEKQAGQTEQPPASQVPPSEPPPGSDPCCYRDPRTGRVWCWC
jgi:hypothetical protein